MGRRGKIKLGLRDVGRLAGVSYRTVWQAEKDGRFEYGNSDKEILSVLKYVVNMRIKSGRW